MKYKSSNAFQRLNNFENRLRPNKVTAIDLTDSDFRKDAVYERTCLQAINDVDND